MGSRASCGVGCGRLSSSSSGCSSELSDPRIHTAMVEQRRSPAHPSTRSLPPPSHSWLATGWGLLLREGRGRGQHGEFFFIIPRDIESTKIELFLNYPGELESAVCPSCCTFYIVSNYIKYFLDI